MTTEPAFLDDEVINNLKELGNGDDDFSNRLLIVQLIHVYLDNLSERTNQLTHGMQTKNAPEVELAAHTLKSSSKLLGLITIGEDCQILENMGFSKDLSKANDVYQRLLANLNKAKEVLPKKIGELEK